MVNYIEKQLPFANKKRVEFISSTIIRHTVTNKEYKILDVGCGTGELFTIPLAMRLQKFKNIKILGIDIHLPSIERAKQNLKRLGSKNLQFKHKQIQEIKDSYDYVCLMAVLEHLTNPKNMLAEIKRKVKKNGVFILYIPNGYGDYEIESKIFRKLRKSKFIMVLRPIYMFLKNFKRRSIAPKNKMGKKDSFIIKETLNDPNNIHIQFFRLKEIKKMLHENGFLIKNIFKTHFITGPFSKRFLYRLKIFEEIDHKIASKIPNILASDWTFICELKEKEE